jgi:putative ATPase
VVADRLFDTGEREARAVGVEAGAPLAVRMRPRGLGELVGQEHVLGEGSALRTAIEAGHPHSAILYGPPGSGKTTLARIAAAGAEGAFEEESAVNAGKAEIRGVIERARERRAASGRPTILFLDEIHRFNKAQQDALLPAVEEGLLTLIGATTENPYFEVNSALLSRCQVYELRSLEPEQVEELLRRALADPERGIADPPPVQDAALEMLAHRSGGDARVALSALERAVERVSGLFHPGAGRKPETVDVAAIEDALQRKALDYDRQGDRHYDFVSAWIKATRGSDVDASLYYLAVMLEGGEDPRFVARRMVILASEDVGNADPQALLVADAAARAVDRVGLPECALNLAQAAVYLALAPKSNASCKGLGAALAEVRENGARTPPDYLRDAHYPGAKRLGRGVGYRYAHDEPDGVGNQPLLPEGLEDARFYEPAGRGFEAELGRRLEELRGRFRRSE